MTKDKYVKAVTTLIDVIISETEALTKTKQLDERLVGKEYKEKMINTITSTINTYKAKLISELLNNYNKNDYFNI